MLDTNGTEKLLSALNKLDSTLSSNGLQNYQERIYRISKAIRSLEAHAYCTVSDFKLSGKNLSVSQIGLPEEDDSLLEELKNNQSSFLTVDNTKHTFEFIDSGNTFILDMDDLLKYIEDELNIKALFNDETNDSSENDDSLVKSKPTITEVKNKHVKKSFFNIEMKLRAFLKQQSQNKVLNKENFQSFMNQQRLQTPMVKENRVNPSFIKNFFLESKAEVEKIRQKRINSIFDLRMSSERLINLIAENEANNLIKSDKLKDFSQSQSQSKKSNVIITSFELDELSKLNVKDIKDDEKLDKNDIISENSESSMDEDEDEKSESEEIEILEEELANKINT